MKRVAMMAMAVLLGCGGSPAQTRSCKLTLSGAINGSYDCRPASTVWAPAIGATVFSFDLPQTASSPAITVRIGWSGVPEVKHYRSSDADANSWVSVSEASDRTWSLRAGSSAVRGGSYDLEVAGILGRGEIYNGEGFSLTGTLDATLSAFALNDLILHVTF
jgi:hypothetical protein